MRDGASYDAAVAAIRPFGLLSLTLDRPCHEVR